MNRPPLSSKRFRARLRDGSLVRAFGHDTKSAGAPGQPPMVARLAASRDPQRRTCCAPASAAPKPRNSFLESFFIAENYWDVAFVGILVGREPCQQRGSREGWGPGPKSQAPSPKSVQSDRPAWPGRRVPLWVPHLQVVELRVRPRCSCYHCRFPVHFSRLKILPPISTLWRPKRKTLLNCTPRVSCARLGALTCMRRVDTLVGITILAT